MTKKVVDTLVQDIYRTIDEGLDKRKTDTQFIQTFNKNIMESINRFLFEKRDDVTTLRLSQIGKPDRQLWYDIKSDIKPDKIDAKTKIKFLYGDILESLLILLTEAAGHDVSEMQKMEDKRLMMEDRRLKMQKTEANLRIYNLDNQTGNRHVCRGRKK